MLRFLETLLPGRTERLQDDLARQVAELSVDAVCQDLADRIAHMSLCEARGYIRARAARELRRQCRILIARQPQVGPHWETAISQRAADRVAPLALRRLTANSRQREVSPLSRAA